MTLSELEKKFPGNWKLHECATGESCYILKTQDISMRYMPKDDLFDISTPKMGIIGVPKEDASKYYNAYIRFVNFA